MQTSDDRRSQHRLLLILAVIAVALAWFQRFPSFFKEHSEGDEIVYVTLAREMGWDLSHYTTKDDPRVSQNPYSIVRQELFHHPPFYALVLKTGDALFSAPVTFGLLFGNAVLLLTFCYAWHWLRMIDASSVVSAVVLAGLATCPLLLFSTTRIAHDGILGMLLACAVVAQIDSLEKPSVPRALIAAGLWVLALNTRYTALAMLPLLGLIQAYYVLFRRGGSDSASEAAKSAVPSAIWVTIIIVWGSVLTLGLQHYVRIAMTYGTIWPSEFITLDDEQFSPFMKTLSQRARLPVAASLLAIFPIGIALIAPSAYRALWRSFRNREWLPVMVSAGVYSLLAVFVFSFQQLRYFAVATPCLCLGLPLLFEQRLIGRSWPLSLGLGAVTLLLMITTGFFNAVLAPGGMADLVPSLFYFVPQLM